MTPYQKLGTEGEGKGEAQACLILLPAKYGQVQWLNPGDILFVGGESSDGNLAIRKKDKIVAEGKKATKCVLKRENLT